MLDIFLQFPRPFQLNVVPLLKSPSNSCKKLDVLLGLFGGELVHIKLGLNKKDSTFLTALKHYCTIRTPSGCSQLVFDTLTVLDTLVGVQDSFVRRLRGLGEGHTLDISTYHLPFFVWSFRKAFYDKLQALIRAAFGRLGFRPFRLRHDPSQVVHQVARAGVRDLNVQSANSKREDHSAACLFIAKIKSILKVQVGRKFKTKEDIYNHLENVLGRDATLNQFDGTLKLHIAATYKATQGPYVEEGLRRPRPGGLVRYRPQETEQQRLAMYPPPPVRSIISLFTFTYLSLASSNLVYGVSHPWRKYEASVPLYE